MDGSTLSRLVALACLALSSGCWLATPVVIPVPLSARMHAGVAVGPSRWGPTATFEAEAVPTQLLACSRTVDVGVGVRLTALPDRPPDAWRVGPSAHVGIFLAHLADQRMHLRLSAALLDPDDPVTVVGAALTWELIGRAEAFEGTTLLPGALHSFGGAWSGGDLAVGLMAAVEHYEDFNRTRYTTATLGLTMRLPMMAGLAWLNMGMPDEARGWHGCDPEAAREWRRARERAHRIMPRQGANRTAAPLEFLCSPRGGPEELVLARNIDRARAACSGMMGEPCACR